MKTIAVLLTTACADSEHYPCPLSGVIGSCPAAPECRRRRFGSRRHRASVRRVHLTRFRAKRRRHGPRRMARKYDLSVAHHYFAVANHGIDQGQVI
jgi:hypothetical protein